MRSLQFSGLLLKLGSLLCEHLSALQKNLGRPKPEYYPAAWETVLRALCRFQRPTAIIKIACVRIAKAFGPQPSGWINASRTQTPKLTDFLRRNLGPDSQHRPLQSGEVGLPSPHAAALFSQREFCHIAPARARSGRFRTANRPSNAAWCGTHGVLTCSIRESHRSPSAYHKLLKVSYFPSTVIGLSSL